MHIVMQNLSLSITFGILCFNSFEYRDYSVILEQYIGIFLTELMRFMKESIFLTRENSIFHLKIVEEKIDIAL